MTTTNLKTVIIYTKRMEDLSSFYQEGLSLDDPIMKQNDHIGYQVGSCYFGFDRVADLRGASPSAVTMWFHVDDIHLTFEKLKNLGAKVGFEPTLKPWGDTLASVYDPDGNILGIATNIKAK